MFGFKGKKISTKIQILEIKNFGVYVTITTFRYESVQGHSQFNFTINPVISQHRKASHQTRMTKSVISEKT